MLILDEKVSWRVKAFLPTVSLGLCGCQCSWSAGEKTIPLGGRADSHGEMAWSVPGFGIVKSSC